MSTNALPAGQFITTISGKRCTAVPRTNIASNPAASSAPVPAVVPAPQPAQATQESNSAPAAASTPTLPPPASTPQSTPAAAAATMPPAAAAPVPTTSTSSPSPVALPSSTPAKSVAAQPSAANPAVLSAAAASASASSSQSLASVASASAESSSAASAQETTRVAATDRSTTAPSPESSRAPTSASSAPAAQTTSPASTASAPATTSATTAAGSSTEDGGSSATSTAAIASSSQSHASQSAADASSATTTTGSQISSTLAVSSSGTGTEAPVFHTTIGTAAGAIVTQGPTGTTGSTSSSTPVLATSNGIGGPGSPSTAAVVGGVIGGVGAIALIAVLVWLFKRRSKQRRSALLTPLSVDTPPPAAADDSWRFQSPPQTREAGYSHAARVKYLVASAFTRTKDRLTTVPGRAPARGGVNLDRGNSQYLEKDFIPIHSRQNSALAPGSDEKVSFGNKVSNGWTKVTAAVTAFRPFRKQQYVRSISTPSPTPGQSMREAPTFDSSNYRQSRPRARTDASYASRNNSRTNFLEEVKMRSAAAGGGLDNPFTDASAIPQPLNPFADPTRGPPPPRPARLKSQSTSSYLSQYRQTRGTSLGGAVLAAGNFTTHNPYASSHRKSSAAGSAVGSSPPSVYYNNANSNSRDSSISSSTADSFSTKRNRFRSDPFDLEAVASAGTGVGESPLARAANEDARGRPGGYGNLGNGHTRQVSSGGSSKYSSGIPTTVVNGEWSDPGPDVGNSWRQQGQGHGERGGSVGMAF